MATGKQTATAVNRGLTFFIPARALRAQGGGLPDHGVFRVRFSLKTVGPLAGPISWSYGALLAASLSLLTHSAQAKHYQLGASLLMQQHPFYIELANTMKAEAPREDVTLNISIANQDLNKQLSDVEDFISKKVDAIIISPVDLRGVQAAIIKAEKAGIPVISVDVAAEEVPLIIHVATDNYADGVAAR